MCCLTNGPLIIVGAHRDCAWFPEPGLVPEHTPSLSPESVPSSEDQRPAVSGSASDPAACQLLTFLHRLCSRCFTEKCDVLRSMCESRAAAFPSTGTSLRGGDAAAPHQACWSFGAGRFGVWFPPGDVQIRRAIARVGAERGCAATPSLEDGGGRRVQWKPGSSSLTPGRLCTPGCGGAPGQPYLHELVPRERAMAPVSPCPQCPVR